MRRRVAMAAALLTIVCGVSAAQTQMPDPKAMSGVPLPDASLPIGTVSVRMLRGGFDKVLPGIDVTFVIDGVTKVVKSDADGRAQVSGIRDGGRVKATATVDGEHLETQEIVISTSGIRFALVATDPEAAKREAEQQKLAAGPAVKGVVALGDNTHIIIEPAEDELNVFYVIEIINSARTPVDIGGPFLLDLPAEARGAGVMDGSAPTAKMNGPRLTVTGPFAPGTTAVQIGYSLPYSGGTAEIRQRWPIALPQVAVLLAREGASALRSPQLATTRETSDQGRPIIVGQGPGLGAGQILALDVTGLPHRPLWPRYTALSLALLIIGVGIVAATRRPAEDPRGSHAVLKAERARLLDALATLEREHAAGTITEGRYVSSRAEMVARLVDVYAAIDRSAAA